MCFSATASFAASAVLVPMGAWCLWSVLPSSPRRAFLAGVPLVFGVQQAAEGLVWTGINTGNQALAHLGARGFLFTALIFWPAAASVVAVCMDSRPWVRRLFTFTAIGGAIFGSLFAMQVLIDPDSWLNIKLVCRSLTYDYPHVWGYQIFSLRVAQFIYLGLTTIPLLTCQDRIARVFGGLLVLSISVTLLFYNYAMVSTWCFLSAIISLYLCVAFGRTQVSLNRWTSGRHQALSVEP